MRNTGGQERTMAGRWLKDRREAAGLTQREIAVALGLDYITMVSQIEAGKARVPSQRYTQYARALKMDPQEFVRELLRYYDVEAWKILFGGVASEHGSRVRRRRDTDD
jgi:transcriptional regulator with XRE-family HTH domain